MKCDIWYVTCDTWHATQDMWTFSQNFSYLALTVWEWKRFEVIFTNDDLLTEWMNEWMNEWMSDNGVCRTVPAKPVLLIIMKKNKNVLHWRWIRHTGRGMIVVAWAWWMYGGQSWYYKGLVLPAECPPTRKQDSMQKVPLTNIVIAFKKISIPDSWRDLFLFLLVVTRPCKILCTY